MIKSILILAQCLLLVQSQVTVRIPLCNPGLGSGTISGELAGATGLGGEGAPGGGGVPGSGNVPGSGTGVGPSS